ncbi:MAG TPA: serine hydrolase [Longimicrobiales bacterium]|nr:serine hydrolase [Longimicrobiales bacterium]
MARDGRHARTAALLTSTPAQLLAALLAYAWAGPLAAQSGYDYHQFTTELVWRGDQALTLCNGLWVSKRPLEAVYRDELQSLLYGHRGGERPYAPMAPDRVSIDHRAKTVAVGIGLTETAPVMRAAYREGVGCVVLAPDQTFDDVASLPELRLPPVEGDAARIPWPDGDLVERRPLPQGVDEAALARAGDWAFDRPAHGGHEGQKTLSLLVVHRGQIVYERYADGIDVHTVTRTWSTAKSITATVAGIAVGKGLLELDRPLGVDWLPSTGRAPDPRRAITLRHVINMSSGLYPVDNDWQPVMGSHLVYFGGWDASSSARNRGLIAEPGTVFDYENFDVILGLLALEKALGSKQAYLEFPHRELFRKIGMRSTTAGVDRFGNHIMSSQVFTNARDLGRLGLLYLNRGVWNGERILPESWVDFVRAPAPATKGTGNQYGGWWWLVPDERADIPQDAYASSGSQGNYTIVIPSQDLVVVRRGLDTESWGPGPELSRWDLLAEVLKAFPRREGATKMGAAAGR